MKAKKIRILAVKKLIENPKLKTIIPLRKLPKI